MSTTPDELSDFVKSALVRGLPRADVEAVLLKAGWTKEQTRSALAGFADTDFPIPVPRPRPYLDAREAFMYLVMFATLYVSAYHLGSLLFDIINTTFPDPADPSSSRQYVRLSMRWSIASLIVAFPVFIYTSWLVARSLGRSEQASLESETVAHLPDVIRGGDGADWRSDHAGVQAARRGDHHTVPAESAGRGVYRRHRVLVLPL